jgi:UDP-N-acetylmuramate dehydrogenase
VSHGYWGLENLAAIPGTVGATPIQNVGAYGVEVKDVIETVRVYDVLNQAFRNLSVAECQFGYRDSVFKHAQGLDLIVVAVTFRVSRVPKPCISYTDVALAFGDRTPVVPQEIYDAVTLIRSKKFPDWHVIGTAGSFFKNPIITTAEARALHERCTDIPLYDTDDGYVKVSLGYVLDKICGLRGYTRGGVSLYKNQALVVVATHGTSATEVMEFVDHIKSIVYEKTQLRIVCEVQYIS